jgi:hypothetical protein
MCSKHTRTHNGGRSEKNIAVAAKRLVGKTGIMVMLAVTALLATGSAGILAVGGAVHSQPTPARPNRPAVQAHVSRLPLVFEQNKGQAASGVDYLSHGPGYALVLHQGDATLRLDRSASPAASLTIHVQGRRSGRGEGQDLLPGHSNYFIGSHPKAWHTNLDQYGKVRYPGIYPGIDLVYYGNARSVEHDFVVSPGANPRKIELSFQGIASGKHIHIGRDGGLDIPVVGGAVRLEKPVVYQPVGGSRHVVYGGYEVTAGDSVRFAVGPYDHSRTLVIDPVLGFSTYLGGSGDDAGYGVALDANGNVLITGSTQSTDFPTINALYGTSAGGRDAFVTKISADGSQILYSTYLGGEGDDVGQGIAVDSAGNAYIAGWTKSRTTFPISAGAYQSTPQGGVDGFAAKLSASGSQLAYCTYLGGSGDDYANGIALDSGGNAYVVGTTSSSNLPTTAGAFQVNSGGGQDAFVVKLNPTGTGALYNTYFGGPGNDTGMGIAVDSSGRACITGDNNSPASFINVNGLPATSGPGYVAVFNPSGTSLVYSTYLNNTQHAAAISVPTSGAAAGNIYVTGTTAGGDAFAWALNPSQAGSNSQIYFTTLGTTGSAGLAIAADPFGYATIAGSTTSANLPVVNPIGLGTINGGTDGFAAKVSTDGSTFQ